MARVLEAGAWRLEDLWWWWWLLLAVIVEVCVGACGGAAALAASAFKGVFEVACPALTIRHDHLPREPALAILVALLLLLLLL